MNVFKKLNLLIPFLFLEIAHYALALSIKKRVGYQVQRDMARDMWEFLFVQWEIFQVIMCVQKGNLKGFFQFNNRTLCLLIKAALTSTVKRQCI